MDEIVVVLRRVPVQEIQHRLLVPAFGPALLVKRLRVATDSDEGQKFLTVEAHTGLFHG